jgi:hypothetical protein
MGLHDVVANGAGFAAVGANRDGRAGAWSSADGSEWRPAVVPEGFRAIGVSATSQGLFAWGWGRAYRSADGLTWQLVETAPWANEDNNALRPCWIDQMGSDVVAMGFMASQYGERPVHWSLDPDGWHLSPDLTTSWQCVVHADRLHAQAATQEAAVELEPGAARSDSVFVHQSS